MGRQRGHGRRRCSWRRCTRACRRRSERSRRTRTMRRLSFLAAALVVAAGSAGYAHHSYGATYDVSKEVRLEGKLVQFVMRNPHSFVTIQTTDGKGAMQRWSVEWS